MNLTKLIFLTCTIVAFNAGLGSSQQLVNIGIGPLWPKDLKDIQNKRKVGWDLTVEYGKIFDQKIAVGADADFMWKTISDTREVTVGNIKQEIVIRKDDIIFFPLFLFVSLDPIPKYVVHPIVRFELGFNMMARSYAEYDTAGNKISLPKEIDKNGFYTGVGGKIGIDGCYDLGPHAAIYVGYEHQIGKLRKAVPGTSNKFITFNSLGSAIRMGVSVLY